MSKLCRITDVQRQGGKKARPGPILVNFEHGKLNPERCGDFSANVNYAFLDQSSGDKKKKPKIELTIKGQHLDYSNNVKSVAGCATSDHLVTYIGIRDKETNTMRLVEANVITVGADVSPPASTNPMLKEKSNGVEGEDMRMRRMEMKKHLVKSFGQAKGQWMTREMLVLFTASTILMISYPKKSVECFLMPPMNSRRTTKALTTSARL